ncbi:MBL fold metallo-hydrolase [Patescibacteria group bacterium]
MNINWLGLSCFEINTKTPSGEVKILVDPYDNNTGLRFPRSLEADIVVSSHDESDANNINAIAGDPFIVNLPGEYEIKNVFVFADMALTSGGKEQEPKENLIIRIESERLRLAHLGALDRELTNQELQILSNVDILMLPVGGNRVMTPKVATAVIGQVEPRVVIPMTHGISNLKEKLSTVDEFCKELGVCRREEASKYKISRKDLPEEDTLIMVLSR